MMTDEWSPTVVVTLTVSWAPGICPTPLTQNVQSPSCDFTNNSDDPTVKKKKKKKKILIGNKNNPMGHTG